MDSCLFSKYVKRGLVILSLVLQITDLCVRLECNSLWPLPSILWKRLMDQLLRLFMQGFEVVPPDKATMEHIVVPAVEALSRKDIEGAQNLFRIALQVLLVRAVNTIILASDDMQDLLPPDDPLLKKCFDPMDALARSTIKHARSAERGP